jgi:4,5:9,10-diseco-3-hydroxy-5,9,17-trioxoandrosta-1(10),2-diene-4-oate hydrolase
MTLLTARRLGCLGAGLAIVLAGVLLLAVTARRPAPDRPWIAEAGCELGYLDLGGRRLRFVRAGSGPAVVLLHGFASSVYTWKDVIPALAASHDVVAIDFPGFGDSSIPDPLDAATYPATVIDVMDRLGIARASLVGNSMGGSVAVAVAAQWPGRVDRLVLIDSAGFNFEAKDRPFLLRAMASPGAGALMEMLPVRRRLVAAGLRQVFHDDALVTDERIDAYAGPMMRPGAARAAAQVLSRRMADFPVARVKAPTLVIWGGDDAWIPVAHAQRFADAITGAQVVILEGCGHLPQEERPAEVGPLLDRFLGPAPRVD